MKKRVRRNAEDARAAILDAAEKRLAEAGPAAIRLQDVADDVGVSHPAVLHHFGSREGLVGAVVERAVQKLEADLLRAIVSSDGVPEGAALFERVFATLSDAGHARLIAWLLLSGYQPFGDEARARWKQIIGATHAMRRAKAKKKPSLEDTRFAVALSALVMFAQAIAGRATFDLAGLGNDRVDARFRRWFSALLAKHLS